MRRLLLIITGIMFIAMLAGCTANEEAGEMSLLNKKMIVGTDIAFENINDFYYTEENINYGAYYQRYRFYVEDGKHLFFHETRERKNDYGPCTEEDTVQIGTIELSDDQWSEFTALINGGTVTARKDSADSGGSGPWLYLYWTNDKSKYQQFSFESYGTEAKFEEFCLMLAPKDDTVKYKLKFSDSVFESERTLYAPGEEVTVRYDIIATDTDYTFYSNDVDFEQKYDGGYVFTFIMPDHDVTLNVKSRNSMEYDPEANISGESKSLKDCITNENIVFDYYEATVATVDGDESTEYVLYGYDDAVMVLALYRKKGDSEETMDYCPVPAYVLDNCMELVRKYNMQDWEEGTGLSGKKYVVKFSDNGKMIRVSSDQMPDNGVEAFDAIGSVLSEEWREDSLNVNGDTWFCPECGTRNNGGYCSECGIEKPD